ncbi:MAG: hypothetical protein LUC91_00730 [Prevotella sp.]|nr:hypothetical protein [Prevotella sp.]
MKTMDFESLDEVFECYGRENLIPIDNLRQLIFYAKHGCQPRFVYENEKKPGRITGWYLKSETSHVYHKWMNENRKKE